MENWTKEQWDILKKWVEQEDERQSKEINEFMDDFLDKHPQYTDPRKER